MYLTKRIINHPLNKNQTFEFEFYSRYNQEINDYLINEIFNDEIYSIDHVQKAPLIIDCGANIGLSLIYFKLIRPQSKIIAFEPDIESFKTLKRNVSLHGFLDVILFNKAVSNTNEPKQLFIHDEDSIDTPPICSLYQNKLTTQSCLVECVNFGEFVSQFDLVDFLKIDIEGGESDLLSSLIESKSIQQIENITLEYHKWVNQQYSQENFRVELEKNGLKSKVFKEEKVSDEYKYTSGNIIIKAHR